MVSPSGSWEGTNYLLKFSKHFNYWLKALTPVDLVSFIDMPKSLSYISYALKQSSMLKVVEISSSKKGDCSFSCSG